MTEFPLSDWETRRLNALYQFEILGTEPEKDYDHIVALASQVCHCPIAAIAFLDFQKTWFKATKGLDHIEVPTHESYLQTQTLTPGTIVIEDTLLDERAKTHDYVTGAPFGRMVVIVPLVTEEGYLVGHLSVADTKPGKLSTAQVLGLEMLAQQTMSLLKLRFQVIKMGKMEKHALRTLELLSPVFNNSLDAVMLSDATGRICQWNPRAEEMFGWTATEAIGRRFQDLLMPERKHHVFFENFERMKNKTSETGKVFQNDFFAKRKNNVDLLVSIGVSRAEIDGETFFIGFLSDLTERKMIARELDKQKRFYEEILNKIPTDIAVFDAEHRYLFVNPFGIKNPEYRKHIIGKDDFEYAAYREQNTELAVRRRAQFLKAKITGEPMRWEDQVKDPEGKTITHLRQFFPVQDDYGRFSFMIGFGIDITARKQLEQEQDVLVERLSFQNTQLIDFCNIVTHNLRGPLNNMSMLIDFIEEGETLEEQAELVSKLRPVVDGLTTTFNQLVETIQIKQDLKISSELVNLESCVKKTLSGLEMELKQAKARLVIDCTDAREIHFPPKYVDSILHNLLSNALKYRAPGRQPLIKVLTQRKGSSVFLTVEDNGLGIDMEKYREHVFKIGRVFHQHANAKGLGLYMTKTQLEVMGSSIIVESEVDKGSKFTVEFRNQEEHVSTTGYSPGHP